jgi:putative hydrolase of the HAD superfamily
VGGVTLEELDAVTIDGYGTLVALDRPVDRLRDALAARGVERDREAVRRAFEAEMTYYRKHKNEGRDADSLAELRKRCAGVFADAAGVPELELAEDFMGALVFEPLHGVGASLARLRARGLALAVVSNWDVGLHDHLDALELTPFFATVVTSAEAGADKPEATIFRIALERLAVSAERALHVGDSEADEQGAAAVGMRFAPAPLAALVQEHV